MWVIFYFLLDKRLDVEYNSYHRGQMIYYVYELHSSLEPGKPFYVGKATEREKFVTSRMYSHLQEVKDLNNKLPVYNKWRQIERLGGTVTEVIIQKFETEEEAFAFEIKLIAKWGLKVCGTGCLYNLCSGGMGGIDRSGMPKEFRQYIQTKAILAHKARANSSFLKKVKSIHFPHIKNEVIERLKIRDYSDIQLLIHMYNDVGMSPRQISRYFDNVPLEFVIRAKLVENGVKLRFAACLPAKPEQRYRIRFTSEQTQDIISMYKLGIGAAPIAMKYHTSPSVIFNLLEANNIKTKTKIPEAIFTPEQVQDIINKYNIGYPLDALGKSYNISRPVIARLLVKNGVNLLTQSESLRLQNSKVLECLSKEIDKKSTEDNIVKAYKLGFSLEEMSNLFGRSRPYITSILASNAVQLRSHSESLKLKASLARKYITK